MRRTPWLNVGNGKVLLPVTYDTLSVVVGHDTLCFIPIGLHSENEHKRRHVGGVRNTTFHHHLAANMRLRRWY
jgi:hypothetical protein